MRALARRIQKLETDVDHIFQRYINSLSIEEMETMIREIEQSLLENGWAREEIDCGARQSEG